MCKKAKKIVDIEGYTFETHENNLLFDKQKKSVEFLLKFMSMGFVVEPDLTQIKWTKLKKTQYMISTIGLNKEGKEI